MPENAFNLYIKRELPLKNLFKNLHFWLSAGTPYTWARTKIFWIWFICTLEGCVELRTYLILKKCKSETPYCTPNDFIGLEEFCKSNILALELYGSQMKDETSWSCPLNLNLVCCRPSAIALIIQQFFPVSKTILLSSKTAKIAFIVVSICKKRSNFG